MNVQIQLVNTGEKLFLFTAWLLEQYLLILSLSSTWGLKMFIKDNVMTFLLAFLHINSITVKQINDKICIILTNIISASSFSKTSLAGCPLYLKHSKRPACSQEPGLITLWHHHEPVRLLTYCWKDNLLVKPYICLVCSNLDLHAEFLVSYIACDLYCT